MQQNKTQDKNDKVETKHNKIESKIKSNNMATKIKGQNESNKMKASDRKKEKRLGNRKIRKQAARVIMVNKSKKRGSGCSPIYGIRSILCRITPTITPTRMRFNTNLLNQTASLLITLYRCSFKQSYFLDLWTMLLRQDYSNPCKYISIQKAQEDRRRYHVRKSINTRNEIAKHHTCGVDSFAEVVSPL